MNKQQILLLTSFILIFTLIILTQNYRTSYEGKISNIETSSSRTIINLEDIEMDFIAFEKIPNLANCTQLKIFGKEETYKNKKQVMINKITCLN